MAGSGVKSKTGAGRQSVRRSAAARPRHTAKYVVQPGDTLHKVARRFSTTALALATLNGLHKPTLLLPGDILIVPDAPASP